MPFSSHILASSRPNRMLHNLELLYAIIDQKCVAEVGDSAAWLSVVLLRLENLGEKNSRISRLKLRSMNHTTAKFLHYQQVKIHYLYQKFLSYFIIITIQSEI
jgi:hypothetical protein